MSDNDTTSPSTDDKKKRGGPLKLVVIGLVCAVLAGAGFVLGGGLSGGDSAEAAEETEEEPEPEEAKIHDIVDLDPVNVNLAGGRYLRIAVSLGLGELEEEGGGGGHGGGGDDEDEPPIKVAPASDLVLSTFSGRDLEQLSTIEGREAARHDLLHGLETYYGEEVVISVLFREFVMQ